MDLIQEINPRVVHMDPHYTESASNTKEPISEICWSPTFKNSEWRNKQSSDLTVGTSKMEWGKD